MLAQKASSLPVPSMSSSQVPSTPSQRTSTGRQRRDLIMLPPESPNALSALMQDDPYDDPLDMMQLNARRGSQSFRGVEDSSMTMDVEVGRDAVPEAQLEFRRDSLAPVAGDDDGSLRGAKNLYSDAGLAPENISFEQPFPLSDGPMQMEVDDRISMINQHDVASLLLEHPDLPLTLSFEMPASRPGSRAGSRAGSVTQSPARNDRSMYFPSPLLEIGDRTPTSKPKKAPRKKTVQKRKELELDFVIELDSGCIMNQMRQTGDITKKPKLVPLTKKMGQLENMTPQDYLGLNAFSDVPLQFAHLFSMRSNLEPVLLKRSYTGSKVLDSEPSPIQEPQDLLEGVFDIGMEIFALVAPT